MFNVFVAVKLQYIELYIYCYPIYYVCGQYNLIEIIKYHRKVRVVFVLTRHNYNELCGDLPGDGHTFSVH